MNAPEKNVPKVAPVDFKTAPHFPIYMDYSATTPIDPRVADKMIPYLREQFGNPASRSHIYGWRAEEAVEIGDLVLEPGEPGESQESGTAEEPGASEEPEATAAADVPDAEGDR